MLFLLAVAACGNLNVKPEASEPLALTWIGRAALRWLLDAGTQGLTSTELQTCLQAEADRAHEPTTITEGEVQDALIELVTAKLVESDNSYPAIYRAVPR